jgi:hypothetical protein
MVTHICLLGGVGCVFCKPGKQEQTMGKQARLSRVIVTAVALAIGSTSIGIRAQAHSLGHGMGSGYHAVPGVAIRASTRPIQPRMGPS